MWLAATAVVEADVSDGLSDALMEAGALSVDIADAEAGTDRERPIFDEPGWAHSAQWLHARVSALFDPGADLGVAMSGAFTAAGLAAETAYEVTRVEDEDWVRKTQSQFKPQKITDRLWVVPTWHALPDPHALNVVLDPGLAFGTGAHPTTRLCLRWLEARVRADDTVVDFGCGSGILAIAALKLGAARASGMDIDRHAVTAALANAQQNGVDAVFVDAAEKLEATGSIVVANILARPLIVLAPLIAQLTASGGRIALSGILAEQAEEVSSAYAPWYDFEPATEEEGWILLSGIRRAVLSS